MSAEAKKYLKAIALRLSKDERITVWHISILVSLLFLWNEGGRKNQAHFSRRRLMALSHIQSIATYHKCIKQLQEYGYFIYEPSYHPAQGSKVTFLFLQ
jgi:hypothetical protein